MNSLFSNTDYVEFLRSLVYVPGAKRGYQVQLAKAMGCQAAYLSQVLKGKAELKEDHAFKLAQFLKLSDPATEYLILLVRLSRASSPALKSYLELRRLGIAREHEEIKGRVRSKSIETSDSTQFRYFSSGFPSLLHIATSSERYRTAAALAERFRLPKERVQEILAFLEEVQLIEKKGNAWHFGSSPLHFPRESSVNIVHQTSRRQQAIRSIEENNPDDIHFSSIFTLDAETYRQLRLDLLDHIEKSHQKIHAGGTTEVYSMCLDLFHSV